MKKQRTKGFLWLGALVLASGIVLLIVGRPMLAFLSDGDAVRAWVEQQGVWARLAFIGMMALQVIVAILPGEPLEICAGYAFGAMEGTLLCLAGAAIGMAVVFVITRKFGFRLAKLFFSEEKLESASFLQDSKRLHLMTFILFFIPGTPKDILGYVLGVTRMRLMTCVALTSVARVPSVVTSTVGGSALGANNIWFAVVVFAATAVVSAAGLVVYNRVAGMKRHRIEQKQ